jgi:hypothetical protein
MWRAGPRPFHRRATIWHACRPAAQGTHVLYRQSACRCRGKTVHDCRHHLRQDLGMAPVAARLLDSMGRLTPRAAQLHKQSIATPVQQHILLPPQDMSHRPHCWLHHATRHVVHSPPDVTPCHRQTCPVSHQVYLPFTASSSLSVQGLTKPPTCHQHSAAQRPAPYTVLAR